MEAEKYLFIWLDKKYGGSPEIGDWTPSDVIEFAEAYHKHRVQEITDDMIYSSGLAMATKEGEPKAKWLVSYYVQGMMDLKHCYLSQSDNYEENIN